MLLSGLSRAAVLALIVFTATPAAAQLIPGWESKAGSWERLDADRVRFMNEVEVHGVGANAGQQIFADDLTFNMTTGEFTASGNVLLVSPTARLSAETVTFNTKTDLGTFETASGMATIANLSPEERSMFGTLEPDVYFYGEKIEKIGEDRYRITRGGFTTCVQPTPRWDVVSNSAVIDVGDYAILRNAVMRVKDVPIFYLPILYYPIQDDDRASGILLPTYGNSSYRGSSISNAFFWAINRSQDATLFHDWFMSRGQGFGAEYRYALAPGSQGELRSYWLNEKAGVVRSAGGFVTPTPDRRSYELRGTLVQKLPGGVDARGILDYFSSLTTKQLYNNNVFDSTLARRQLSGAVTKAWSAVNLNGIFQQYEAFYTPTDSIVTGSAPSVTASLSSQQIAGLPLYVAANANAGRVLYLTRRQTETGITEDDRNLNTFDTRATIRSPFSRLAFLSATASLNYHYGRFSHSLDASGRFVPEPATRRYMDLAVEALGPTFTRVFTPQNAVADRLKHIIEPQLAIRKTTTIDQQDRIVTHIGNPIVGDVTRVTYGLANRLLVRKTPTDPDAAKSRAASAPRELLGIVISQSYYTNPRASRVDYTYGFSYGYRPANSFSPVALSVRSQLSTAAQLNFRMEYDPIALTDKFTGFNLGGTVNSRTVQATAAWSQRRYGSGSALVPDNYIQADTTLRTRNQRFSLNAGVNYDIKRKTLTQHRWIGSYNAQCCGIAIEYQEYNYPASFLIPQDRRFNLSFSLAGIGTFSNFFGTFGGGRY